MEGGKPPGNSSSVVMTIATPPATGVVNAPLAPTVPVIASPGSGTIAPPTAGTQSTSIPPSIPPPSLPPSPPSSSTYPTPCSPPFSSSSPSSIPTVSTSEQQLQQYQHPDLPHHSHHFQQEQEQEQQPPPPQEQQQLQLQQQDSHNNNQQQPISLFHSPATSVDRRIYFPPSRESRRTFRAEDGRCYFLPKCIHFRPVSTKHAKASLHLQVSAGVYLCNGERCSEKGGNVDFRATPIITKKQVLVFRAFRNLLGWRPIGEPPVVLHELLASEVFRLWEKTRRLLDEHAPPISDDDVIRISPPLNKIGGGSAVIATPPAPAAVPTSTSAVTATVGIPPSAPEPSTAPPGASDAPAPATAPVAAPTPADTGIPAAVAAGAPAVDPAASAPSSPPASSSPSSSVELVMRAGELRRVSRDKRKRCNEIYERLLADELVLSGTLEESPTGELPTAADKKAAEKAMAAAAGIHRRILPAHRLPDTGSFAVAGASSPMDVVIGGIQPPKGGVVMGTGVGGGFVHSTYDTKPQEGCAVGYHGTDIHRSTNGPTIGAVSQFGSPSSQTHARDVNGNFHVSTGGTATSYRPSRAGRAFFPCGGERGCGDSGPSELVHGHACARDPEDGSGHQHQRHNNHASRSCLLSVAAENGGGANGLRYSPAPAPPGDFLGSPAAKRQRVDDAEGNPPDGAASTINVGGIGGSEGVINGHATGGSGVRAAAAGGEAEAGVPTTGSAEDPASGARRQMWFREVQLNDARLQELRERAEREHARRRSELMSWMVDEEGGKHNGLGPFAGPEPASWDYRP